MHAAWFSWKEKRPALRNTRWICGSYGARIYSFDCASFSADSNWYQIISDALLRHLEGDVSPSPADDSVLTHQVNPTPVLLCFKSSNSPCCSAKSCLSMAFPRNISLAKLLFPFGTLFRRRLGQQIMNRDPGWGGGSSDPTAQRGSPGSVFSEVPIALLCRCLSHKLIEHVDI